MLQFGYRPQDRENFVRFFSKTSVCYKPKGRLLQKHHGLMINELEIRFGLLGGSAGADRALRSNLSFGKDFRYDPFRFSSLQLKLVANPFQFVSRIGKISR